MLGNRDPGALQRHAGHERRLVNAEPGGGPLNLLLDVRPGALLHPRRLRLVDGGSAVVEAQHGSIPCAFPKRMAIRRTPSLARFVVNELRYRRPRGRCSVVSATGSGSGTASCGRAAGW